ncbi:MAG: glycosyltransferase family 4 protein [Patescibacteria group bacterium]
MKILMLTPYLPYPPASGGQIRTLNLLKYLRAKNEITLIALYKNDSEKKYLPYLKPYCKEVYLCKRPEKAWQPANIYRSIFSLNPFLIVRNYSSQASATLKELICREQFDVIHAETFYIMPHILKTQIPILLVEQTIEYKVYQHYVNSLPFFIRPLFSLDILKLKFWERFYWRKAFLVGAVSESDQKTIAELEPSIKPIIIPNGAGEEMITPKLTPKSLIKPVVLFVGNFFWLQNTEAAKYLINKIYPKLIKAIPNVKLVVAGQNARNKLDTTNTDNLTIIDIDPNDSQLVKKLYSEATIFVAPIYGPGGTRLKILAAMSSGLPIVTTRTGIEGLDVVDNKQVLIANTPSEFVRDIKKILQSKETYNRIRKNAYELVKEKYNWKKIAEELEIAYKRLKKS